MRYTSGWWFDSILSWYSEELLLSHSAEFLLSDIVVVLGRGYVKCLDSHVIISVQYTSGLLRIPMVSFSGHQGRLDTSDAILGHIPFQRIFMDLHRGHMFENRWFHAIWSPTYHTFRCHIGAYFGSDEIYRSWGNRVLILIWRDVCRDDDIFAILTMIP